MEEPGEVSVKINNNIAVVTFSHSKGNSLPSALLKSMADDIKGLSENEETRVIVLASKGEGAFCGGASFTELLNISTYEEGKEFFMGFARLINAMKNCPKFIIARVQGKAVGGGVGIVAASDYALALSAASVKLSELELGIGPFVVGPAVERKIGKSAFSALSIDTNWRDALWAENNGLYTDVFQEKEELDKAVLELAVRLSKTNPEAMARLKSVLWEGTGHWETLLETRAEISGKLVLSEFTSNYISTFKDKKS
ncbi:MAG: enoyl-CoA hydratase/isomerase family protein [Syntrophomonadaceae bacterium]